MLYCWLHLFVGVGDEEMVLGFCLLEDLDVRSIILNFAEIPQSEVHFAA